MSITSQQLLTAEAFLRLPLSDAPAELIDGMNTSVEEMFAELT